MRPFTITLLLALLVTVGGCKRANTEETGASPKAVVAVKIVPIMAAAADVEVHATGQLEALRKEDVIAPVAGRLTSLKVLEGEFVKAGDVLAVIEPRESQAAIEGARALLSRAKTDSARAEAERVMALADLAKTQVKVTAPFNGIVAARSANEGQLLTDGSSFLTLVDLSTLVFMADVRERDLPRIIIGEKARIRLEALPGSSLNATVDAINPQSNAESQSVKVRLGLAVHPSALLKTGMAGLAAIVVGTHPDALLVPRKAVLRNDETDQHSVVIIGQDSLSHTIPVELGVQSDSLDEVVSNRLKAGMSVVVEGQYALPDSTRVTATSEGSQ
jgi:RND family efflux transporter MFP subunit